MSAFHPLRTYRQSHTRAFRKNTFLQLPKCDSWLAPFAKESDADDPVSAQVRDSRPPRGRAPRQRSLPAISGLRAPRSSLEKRLLENASHGQLGQLPLRRNPTRCAFSKPSRGRRGQKNGPGATTRTGPPSIRDARDSCSRNGIAAAVAEKGESRRMRWVLNESRTTGPERGVQPPFRKNPALSIS